MPTQGADRFSRLFHHAEESQEMPCFHVPMNVAGAYPSFSSLYTQAFTGELCGGWVAQLCLLDPARCSVHHSFAWSFGAGLGDPWGSWSCLGVRVWHSPSVPLPLVQAAEKNSCENVPMFMCCSFSCEITKQTCALGMIVIWTLLNRGKKSPSVLQRGSVKSRLCD